MEVDANTLAHGLLAQQMVHTVGQAAGSHALDTKAVDGSGADNIGVYIPLFAGFISKLYLTSAALETMSVKMVVGVVILAISTILNALYFIRAVISVYTARNEKYNDPNFKPGASFCVGMVCFIVINFMLGLASYPLIQWIEQGLNMFS